MIPLLRKRHELILEEDSDFRKRRMNELLDAIDFVKDLTNKLRSGAFYFPTGTLFKVNAVKLNNYVRDFKVFNQEFSERIWRFFNAVSIYSIDYKNAEKRGDDRDAAYLHDSLTRLKDDANYILEKCQEYKDNPSTMLE